MHRDLTRMARTFQNPIVAIFSAMDVTKTFCNDAITDLKLYREIEEMSSKCLYLKFFQLIHSIFLQFQA